MSRWRVAGPMLIAATLAGCAGGASLSDSTPAPAELAMPGRWMLAAPNAPACGLSFTARPGATEGMVSPEGGCPERFFTSRRWPLRQTALTISDDNNNELAQFSYAGDRFEGKSSFGTALTLAR